MNHKVRDEDAVLTQSIKPLSLNRDEIKRHPSVSCANHACALCRVMLDLSEQLNAVNCEIESRDLMTMEFGDVLTWLEETRNCVGRSWEMSGTLGHVTDTLRSTREVGVLRIVNFQNNKSK